MSNISKTIFFTLVVVILVIAGFKLSNKTQNEEPIIIGAILPQTGIAAIVGETERQGIELAVKEINDEGGVDGRMFRVAFEDDRTDPKETVTAIRKLTSTQDVSAIIGGTWDFLANAAIPVAEAEQVVLISPSALPDTLEKESPYYFVTHSPVSSVESAVKRWLISNNTKRVVLMSVNNLWGQAHLKTFRKATEGQGITILKEIVVPQF
ncbi:amino acid ABC transporter substrate-binding protein, partial [Patescibacteria group bacterium]